MCFGVLIKRTGTFSKKRSGMQACEPKHLPKAFRKMRTLGPDGRPHSRRRRDEAGSSNPPPQPVGYPGGPSDLSLLVRYQDHVARRLWYGEERGSKKELKVAGHGTKLQERVPQQLPPEIEAIVSRSGLASLQRTSLTKIDVNLVSAFVERWHVETSSFHMPFGEMTITLDDVACLLHLPINGMFWYPDEHVTEQVAVDLGCELLGVDRHAMAVHVRSCRGAYYSLQWLYDRFVQYRAAGSWTYATRAYLMMLVGSTIFADKTFTLVEARYLLLFRDLRGLGSYSWASAALATLYRHLGDASMFSCKQLGGYPTLLQCWIHEYFSTLGRKGENWRSDNQGLPRAMRWFYRQGAIKVDAYRPILDELTPTDVIWRPFEDHRPHIAFNELSLYRGFLVWGDIHVLYLPDRCLRQFGIRQYIPPAPPADTLSNDEIAVEWIGYHQSVTDVIRGTEAVGYPHETVDGYLEWYYRVSHPQVVPPPPSERREVPVPVFDAGPADPDWARASTLVRRYLRQVEAEEDDVAYADLFEVLRIAYEH
ncbi:protein MAIN-LIKE 1-like [Vicia villosa]|uniref:protein MAIN-LIKE 1-like n=1 Tax=Vicia villosa TaxID=3911 RepID=UPI00273B54D4|nr:protein MAIN-LIKE 1-like [Vicia villosa]